MGFYREETVFIPAGQTIEVTYGQGENPNYFFINNMSPVVLYGGISYLPTETRHEVKVPASGNKLAARKNGSTKFYIYNSSTSNSAQIILTAFAQDFDPLVLAMLSSADSAGSSGGSGGGGTSFDGIIQGFNCELPAGDNGIGSVGLLAGSQHVGSVGVDSVPSVVTSHFTASEGKQDTTNSNLVEIKTSNAAIKTLLETANTIWTNEKINTLLTAVSNIVAVAGGEQIAGTTAQKVLSLANTTNYWNLATENKFINKICYLRCLSGTVKVYFNQGAAGEGWENDMLTLSAGDCITDYSAMINDIVLQGTTADAKAEILYTYIANTTA